MLYGEVQRQRLKIVRDFVVADTIDYLEMQFSFSEDWEGLSKWAHFSAMGKVYDIPLTDNTIRKEDHLNLSAGIWAVYLHGNEFADGVVVERITTNAVMMRVEPTGGLNGEPFAEAPASEVERILARLDALEKGGVGGGITEEKDPTVPDWAKQKEKPKYTAAEVGALPEGTRIPARVSELQNDSGFITRTVADLVNYYRKTEVYARDETYSRAETDSVIAGLEKRLNGIADSDDVTLDQLSEIVAYIKNNKTLIESVTTAKVSVDDIVNNLKTSDAKKPLSSEQGVVLNDADISDVEFGKWDYSSDGTSYYMRIVLKSGGEILRTLPTHNPEDWITSADRAPYPSNGQFDSDWRRYGSWWVDETRGVLYLSQNGNAPGAGLIEHGRQKWLEIRGGLPEHTAADEGKSLRVVDGAAAWTDGITDAAGLIAAVAAGGEVTLAPDADITVSETLNLPVGTVIHGSGATVRRAAGFEEILFFMNAGSRIENFVIEGNRSAMVSPAWDRTIEIATRANCVIDGITINDANEAIVVYQDDVIVRGCRLNNCGGNGIHMSGANRTRIEDCVIIGANKSASQMGNANGCIYWCQDANETVVTGCHCEDGLAGFGGIDGIDNCHLKIIGCTVKDCDKAAFGEYKSTGGPIDVVISGNQFIECGNLELSDASNNVVPGDGLIISDNVFTDTGIWLQGFRNAVVRGNVFSNNVLTGYAVRLIRCPNVLVEGNSINSPNGIAIVMDLCSAANILGNTIRYKTNAINTSNSTGVTISNNVVRQVLNGGTGNAFHFNSSQGAGVDYNRIYAYTGGGIVVPSNARATGNFIDMANSSLIAIRAWGGQKNYVVAQNMTNGTYGIATGTGAVVQNNVTIDITAFVDVVYTLTNLTTDGFAKALTGDDFGFTLTAADGYSLPDTIVVTMDGTALAAGTGYAYDAATGAVVVYRVSGAVEVTAGGV